jgi:hypothetical protein
VSDQDDPLVRELRELPPLGSPPDWNALQRSIDAAIGDAAPPRRRAWWPALGFAAVGLAAVVLVALRLSATNESPKVAHIAPNERVTEPTPPAVLPLYAVYLDGDPVDLTAWRDGDEHELDDPYELAEDVDGLVLPGSDLAWVDDLDDASLDALDELLERGAT